MISQLSSKEAFLGSATSYGVPLKGQKQWKYHIWINEENKVINICFLLFVSVWMDSLQYSNHVILAYF